MQSRGDRLSGFAKADESDSRFAVIYAFLVRVLRAVRWLRRFAPIFRYE